MQTEVDAASAPRQPSKRPLKVYGWSSYHLAVTFNGSAHVIVATTSFAKACASAEAAGIEKPARGYYSETRNEQDLETALAQPGQVFATLDGYGEREFFPVRGGKIDKNA